MRQQENRTWLKKAWLCHALVALSQSSIPQLSHKTQSRDSGAASTLVVSVMLSKVSRCPLTQSFTGCVRSNELGKLAVPRFPYLYSGDNSCKISMKIKLKNMCNILTAVPGIQMLMKCMFYYYYYCYYDFHYQHYHCCNMPGTEPLRRFRGQRGQNETKEAATEAKGSKDSDPRRQAPGEEGRGTGSLGARWL